MNSTGRAPVNKRHLEDVLASGDDASEPTEQSSGQISEEPSNILKIMVHLILRKSYFFSQEKRSWASSRQEKQGKAGNQLC